MTLYSFLNGEYFYSSNTLSFQENYHTWLQVLNEALINTLVSPHLKLLWELRSETWWNVQDTSLGDPKGICFLPRFSTGDIPFENPRPIQKWTPFRSSRWVGTNGWHLKAGTARHPSSPQVANEVVQQRQVTFPTPVSLQHACKATYSPAWLLLSAVTQWKAAPPSSAPRPRRSCGFLPAAPAFAAPCEGRGRRIRVINTSLSSGGRLALEGFQQV